MKFYKTDSISPVTDYLAKTLKEHTLKNEKILWLVTGGSAIEIAVETSQKLAGTDLSNLFVTLTDERFVLLDDSDSNWKQLADAGFDLPNAKLFPILNNEDIKQTAERYADILQNLFNKSDYKIGLFGMGSDGHIAALFPRFPQLREKELYAISFNNSPKPPPLRLTMTLPAIQKLDEAIIFARGEEKKTAIERLNQDLSITKQPAQILKTLPKLSVYNDQIGEEI